MFRRDFTTLALVPAAIQVGVEPLTTTRYADSDHYVLTPSRQAGFCQSILDRSHSEPEECRPQQDTANKANLLTMHGLWPRLSKSITACGVDERHWMRYGYATRPMPNIPEAKTNRKCQAAETGLSLETVNKLNNAMPGPGDTSYLERYGYVKHGVCFGLDLDSYFGTMVHLNGEIRHGPVGDFLAKYHGQTVSRADFGAAMAHTWGPQSVEAFKLTCNGNPVHLTETQVSLDAATINAPLVTSAFLPQPHPGNCGTQFILDKAGQQYKAMC